MYHVISKKKTSVCASLGSIDSWFPLHVYTLIGAMALGTLTPLWKEQEHTHSHRGCGYLFAIHSLEAGTLGGAYGLVCCNEYAFGLKVHGLFPSP